MESDLVGTFDDRISLRSLNPNGHFATTVHRIKKLKAYSRAKAGYVATGFNKRGKRGSLVAIKVVNDRVESDTASGRRRTKANFDGVGLAAESRNTSSVVAVEPGEQIRTTQAICP